MRFIRENLYPLAAVVALAAAIVSWFASPDPLVVAPGAAAATPWALPKPLDNQSTKSAEAINARNLWGVVAANAPKLPSWTVMGLARSGAERYVLVATEGRPVVESLKVGDMLPDGAKIVQIDADRFYVLTPEKKKIAFGIYKNDAAK